MIMHKASEIAEKVNRNKTVNIEANAAGRMYSGAMYIRGVCTLGTSYIKYQMKDQIQTVNKGRARTLLGP